MDSSPAMDCADWRRASAQQPAAKAGRARTRWICGVPGSSTRRPAGLQAAVGEGPTVERGMPRTVLMATLVRIVLHLEETPMRNPSVLSLAVMAAMGVALPAAGRAAAIVIDHTTTDPAAISQ